MKLALGVWAKYVHSLLVFHQIPESSIIRYYSVIVRHYFYTTLLDTSSHNKLIVEIRWNRQLTNNF